MKRGINKDWTGLRVLILSLLVVTVLVALAYAQYAPVPNGSGLQVRNAFNNKLSGADAGGISPKITGILFSQLPAAAANGQVYYVRDAAYGTPCIGGGPGALAIAVNGIWVCGQLPGGPAAPNGVTCSHQSTVVGAGAIIGGSTNNAGFFTTPISTVDVDNCTIVFSVPSPNNRLCAFQVSNFDNSVSIAGVAGTQTSTTAQVNFASGGGTTTSKPLTIDYSCF